MAPINPSGSALGDIDTAGDHRPYLPWEHRSAVHTRRPGEEPTEHPRGCHAEGVGFRTASSIARPCKADDSVETLKGTK